MKKTVLAFAIMLQCIMGFSQEKPNVLLIMVDDMNDWVGAFGGNSQAITPNIDKFAKKSVIFKNAYCSAPLCNPSRTSLLTGYLPARTGVYGNSEVFRDIPAYKNVVTLPQYFYKNGYTTAAAGKIFHSPRGTGAKPKPGSDPGSFEMEDKGGLGSTFPEEKDKFTHGLDFSYLNEDSHITRTFDWKGVDVAIEKTADWKSADYAARFLKEKHDKPFFLACGIFRPHLPWYAPQKFFDMYNVDDIKIPEVIANDLDDVGPMGKKIAFTSLHEEIVKKNQWKEAVRAYLANLSYADACVGHLLDNLETSAFNKNTIVVIMGDHGWHLGEKTHWTKSTVWEESAKTPLLIFDPRNGNKGVSTKIVSLIDVYPTLLDLCNLPAKADLDGKSFKNVLTNSKGDWKNMALTSKNENIHSLRNENYRYIKYSDGFEELYDHRIDPMEWKNIAKDNANKAVILNFRKELEAVLTKVKK